MDYQTLSTDWHLKDIRNKVSSRTGTEIIFKLITLQVNKSKFAFNRCSRTATVCFHLSDEKHSSLMKLTSQENQARKGDIPSFLWPKLLVFTTVANRAEWRGTIAVQSLQVQELPSPSQSHAVYLKRQTHSSAFHKVLPHRSPPPHRRPSGLDHCLRRWRDLSYLSGVYLLDAAALTSPWSRPEMSPDITTTSEGRGQN